MKWSNHPEAVEIVRVHWLAGDSYEIIGNRIGVNKNSVAGIVSRNRSEWESGGARRKGGEATALRKKSKKRGVVLKTFEQRLRKVRKARSAPPAQIASTPIPRIVEPPKLFACDPVSLLARQMDQCAYPLDDDGSAGPDMRCCGRPVEFGYSWCSFHRRVIFAVGAQ